MTAPTWIQLSDDVRIIQADCLELLPIDADACITDQPYGIGYAHSGGGGSGIHNIENTSKNRSFYGPEAIIIGDDKPFDPTPFLGYSKIVLFGANHYADKLPKSSKWLVWDKIVIPETYGKFTFSDCELAWTNQPGTARIYKQLWQGCRRAGESNAFGKLHPNRKPVELMLWVMDQVKVPVGATVIDPFMGSGTTGVACIRSGRKFIGIEIDPKYFAIAKERLETELRQLPLSIGF